MHLYAEGHIPFEIIAGRTYPTPVVNDGTIQEVFLAFKFRLLFILQACADRLRTCQWKNCKTKFFLKTTTMRSDKDYCSRSCGSAVRQQRRREKDKRAKQRKGRNPHGAKKKRYPKD